MNLTATNESLELVTSAAGSIDYNANFSIVDKSGSTAVSYSSSAGNITTATTTTLIAAPGASVYRIPSVVSIRNASATVGNTVTVQKDVAGADRTIISVTLAPGESLEYTQSNGWVARDLVGRVKAQGLETAGYTGRTIPFYKVGVTMEAIGVHHSHHAATGFPGAWAPGTPGAAGRTTDGTTTTDGGCLPIWTPTGSLYLTQAVAATSVVCALSLIDILWVNSGLTVTTTTAQNVNSVAWPARDLNGSTNGEGIEVGILVTTATTNAGAVTNTTMSYTDSDGNAGATATMASFPATAVAGTLVPFRLATGDRGVRSIQTVTLGTSYGGGAISIIAFRRIAQVPCLVANVGGTAFMNADQNPGVRLWNGSCLIPIQLPAATTATNITGLVQIMER